jgi:pyrroloquinoline-quinone synthase
MPPSTAGASSSVGSFIAFVEPMEGGGWMEFWTSLASVRERNDVLRHPFYRRWSAGTLQPGELAHYAGQYRHAVVALARASANAARSVDPSASPALRAQLQAHAREEAEHVGLWDCFCTAVGGSVSTAPAPETARCAEAWAGARERPLLRTLVALHAIEAAQPAIARAKLDGLTSHYGASEGPATAYFELHERLDVEHAAATRRLIAARLDGDQADDPPSAAERQALLAEAEAVLRGNWLLLDGVERVASPRAR